MSDGEGQQGAAPRALAPFSDSAPIIVTAAMAPADAAWATGLRDRYFPPARNQLKAHVTLFHHLQPSALSELRTCLANLAKHPPLKAEVSAIFSLGGGVALRVDCPQLLAIRADIADRFGDLLVPQDRAKPRLHITIQNKVTAAIARATLAELTESFVPRSIRIAGFEAFYYRGGPWEPIARYPFRG